MMKDLSFLFLLWFGSGFLGFLMVLTSEYMLDESNFRRTCKKNTIGLIKLFFVFSLGGFFGLAAGASLFEKVRNKKI